MKTTGIISALIFAHAAFAQASDSSSVAVSSGTGSASVPASTSAGAATGSASSASVVAASTGVSSSGSASASASPSGTKTGTKSASSAAGSSAAAATTSSVDAGSSGGSPTSIPLAATSAVSSSSGNPLIPDSAGATCTEFLKKMNADTAMSSCFTPMLNALSAFNPTSGSGSASAITKTLNNLCGSNACPASTVRSKLTSFKDACGDELSRSDPTVVGMYDVLYTVTAFKAAICTKDQDTQAYCLLNIGTGSSVANTTQSLATGPSESVKYAEGHLANSLVSSRRRAQSVLIPNTDTYRNTNLIYLFTSPDMNSGELCTSCTQQIISKYVSWESTTPHALGVKNSPLLGGQSELWTAIQDKCPASFLSEVSNIAGVASADQISGAVPALKGGMATALFGALAAFALI
ncbi:hypothetical protein BDV93DRAFT_484141 [Ceratobasidium sp. AG-I]|nr:hypothetical protein BDV93DRAFT_484141 [Ceratobasidium sp. AG-I]